MWRLIIIGFVFQTAFSQADNVLAVRPLPPSYKDFVVSGRDVFGLTTGDSLYHLNLKTGTKRFVVKSIATATSHSGKLIAVQTDGTVLRMSKNGTPKAVIGRTTGNIYKVFCDKKGHPVVLSSEGVFYQQNQYVPVKGSPMYRKAGRIRASDFLIRADVYFLDSHRELIWFGYDAGEWGGNVCFFDLNTKEFSESESLFGMYLDKYPEERSSSDRPTRADLLKEFPDKIRITQTDTLYKFPHDLYLSHLKGITADNKGNYWASESLMHFFVNGSITKIEKGEDDFYKSKYLENLPLHEIRYYNDSDQKTRHYQIYEYLGPTTFNPFNESIYYYSDKGFIRIVETADGQYTRECYYRPRLTWTAGLPDAVGYQMNVTKMEFLSEKEIIYLSNRGIGYYDGILSKYY